MFRRQETSNVLVRVGTSTKGGYNTDRERGMGNVATAQERMNELEGDRKIEKEVWRWITNAEDL